MSADRNVDNEAAPERTGEARQAWWGGWGGGFGFPDGGWGGFGGWGGYGWGGFGVPFYGGFGFPYYGGWGGYW